MTQKWTGMGPVHSAAAVTIHCRKPAKTTPQARTKQTTDSLAHGRFYTLLHTEAFTHRRFHTQTLLHTDTFFSSNASWLSPGRSTRSVACCIEPTINAYMKPPSGKEQNKHQKSNEKWSAVQFGDYWWGWGDSIVSIQILVWQDPKNK